MKSPPQKVAIVTGANNGIGFETTVGMAEAGYHVVMACRSREKAEAARADVMKRVPSPSLDIILLDLGDFTSVRAFSAAFREAYEHFDVLINNAGILLSSPQSNGDGIELQLATNHLGHFLLTSLLMDLVPDDASSRVIALSSVAHKSAHIHFEDLSCGGDGGTAYGQSKLACLLFGDELARRLRASGKKIKSISVHPGGSDSGLFGDMDAEQRDQLKKQVEHLLHSNASAAKPALFAALSTTVTSGGYYGPTGPQEMSGAVGNALGNPISEDAEVAKRLWSLSEELTGQPFSV